MSIAPLLGFMLLCLGYAGGMVWLFDRYDSLQNNKLVHLGHLSAFLLQVYVWFRINGGISASGGMIGGAVSSGVFMLGLAVICLLNALPVTIIIASYLSGAGRWFLSLDQIRVPKTYEKAEAAEAEGDLPRAAEIYREEIQKDPEDPSAARRLAEVLIRTGDLMEAVEMLRRVRELTEEEKPNTWCSATFRLAEVLADLPHGAGGAARLYQQLIRRHPDSEYAEHARTRLRALDLE